MMKRLRNIALLMVLVLIGSCANEEMQEPALVENNVQIKLSLGSVDEQQTKASSVEGTPEENAIHTLQIFIFKANGQIEKNINLKIGDVADLADDIVWHEKTQTITMRNFPDLAAQRSIYAIANADIDITKIHSTTDLSDAFTTITLGQPSLAPTATKGMVMSGMQQSFRFSDSNNKITVFLAHQVAKVKLTVRLALESSYPFLNFRVGPITVRALNVPDRSYIIGYGNSGADKLGATMMDIDYGEMVQVGDEWNIQMYLYENDLLGDSEGVKKKATKFIISVPYFDGTTTTTANYYLVYPSNKSHEITRPYATAHNNFYDVTVTVKHLGGVIPAIDGTEVITSVLPWTGVGFDINTDNINVIELSNTMCDIYGDQADNILVGTAVVNREGVAGTAYISSVGNGFYLLSPSTVTLEEGKPTEIRIKTIADFTGGKVIVKMVKETKEIIINKKKEEPPLGLKQDNALVAISDAAWCTLSLRRSTDFAEQQQFISQGDASTIYINPTKRSFNEKSRMANIMLTTTEAIKRVIVVQKPGITSADGKIQWATGNICLGKRPDGKGCYVIGGAREQGLWFMFNRNAGFEYSKIGKWSDNPYVYVPTGTGSSASVERVRENNVYLDVYNSGRYVGDPCTSVYNENPAIKWRTPTNIELGELAAEGQNPAPVWWSKGDGNPDQYLSTLNGALTIRLTGKRKEFDGTPEGTEGYQSVAVHLWSSVKTPASVAEGRAYYFSAYNWGAKGEVKYVEEHAALAVRCVRDIKKN